MGKKGKPKANNDGMNKVPLPKDSFGKIKRKNYVSDFGREYITFKDTKSIFGFAVMIMELAKKGHTMEMILHAVGIPASVWIKNYKQHKILRRAVEDSKGFHKAHGQLQLQDMAKGKKQHSPQIAKIWFSSFYDIKEEYVEPSAAAKKDEYKVSTQMVKEEAGINLAEVKEKEGVVADGQ